MTDVDLLRLLRKSKTLTAREAMEALGPSRNTFYRRVAEGAIPYVQLSASSRRRYQARDIARLLGLEGMLP